MDGSYGAAAQQFKRAVALVSPPDNVSKAFDLLATIYISQNNLEDAIKAYKSSISMAPQDDDTAHIKPGNIYSNQDRRRTSSRRSKSI